MSIPIEIPVRIVPSDGLIVDMVAHGTDKSFPVVLDTGASAFWIRSSLISKDLYLDLNESLEINYFAGKICGEKYKVPIKFCGYEYSDEILLIVDSLPLWWTQRAMIGLSRGSVQPSCNPIWQNLTKSNSFCLQLPKNSPTGTLTFGISPDVGSLSTTIPMIPKSPEWSAWLVGITLVTKTMGDVKLAVYDVPKENLDEDDRKAGWVWLSSRYSYQSVPQCEYEENVNGGKVSQLDDSFVDLGTSYSATESNFSFGNELNKSHPVDKDPIFHTHNNEFSLQKYTYPHSVEDNSDGISACAHAVFDCGHGGTALAAPNSFIEVLGDTLVKGDTAVWAFDKFGRRQLKILETSFLKSCSLRIEFINNILFEFELEKIVKKSTNNLPSTLNISTIADDAFDKDGNNKERHLLFIIGQKLLEGKKCYFDESDGGKLTLQPI